MHLKLDQHFPNTNGNLGISGSVKHNFKKVGIISYIKNVETFENFFEFCVGLNAIDIMENNEIYEVETDLEAFRETLRGFRK